MHTHARARSCTHAHTFRISHLWIVLLTAVSYLRTFFFFTVEQKICEESDRATGYEKHSYQVYLDTKTLIGPRANKWMVVSQGDKLLAGLHVTEYWMLNGRGRCHLQFVLSICKWWQCCSRFMVSVLVWVMSSWVLYCAWGTFGERERYRQRRKWRHHCRAKIGDEFTLSLAKTSHNWRWAYTFPCQKFALFVSPFTLPVSPFAERSPWWRWNSQWVHTFHCQKFFRPRALFPLFQMARAARRIENPRQMIKSCPVLFFFPLKKGIKLIPKTIGNRKRDCAWGGSGW